MSFKVLESVLRPLAYWYNQENIEEVAVNRSGQVWLRLLRQTRLSLGDV